jgi:hypothetical protein
MPAGGCGDGGLMARRPPKGGVGEPLFGEDWWSSDQRLFQDSLARPAASRAAPRRARRPASMRGQDADADGGQLVLPWFGDAAGEGDEPVRADGAGALGALGALAADPVRGDSGSGR